MNMTMPERDIPQLSIYDMKFMPGLNFKQLFSHIKQNDESSMKLRLKNILNDYSMKIATELHLRQTGQFKKISSPHPRHGNTLSHSCQSERELAWPAHEKKTNCALCLINRIICEEYNWRQMRLKMT
jgi:hypothetical protein